MSKTITVSDETYALIEEQVEAEKKESAKTKLQIKTLAGEVLFESEKTTIKEAVEEAVAEYADLRCANLGGADLGGANLRYADLRCADLGGADLRCANLGGANLGGANLRYADLGGANFYNTKFYGKGGTTQIKKSQIDDFFKALGVIVEE